MTDEVQTATTWANRPEPALPTRPAWPAIKRGLLGTCPNCGSGRLFTSFLKPVNHCAACHEDLSHHRADDLPAYLVILLVGHIVVGGFMMTDLVWPMSNWAHLAIWVPLTLILALALIQPIKGGVIGLQWAMRMHGFGGEEPGPEDQLGA
jgi:uncharacterized protein (DUF983 family)